MKGGRREGAGRKKGSANKVTTAAKEKALKGGIMPLDYMLGVLRKPIPPRADIETKMRLHAVKMDAAKAAAPYVHPKLNSTVLTGPEGGPIQTEVAEQSELNIARRVAFILAEGARKVAKKP